MTTTTAPAALFSAAELVEDLLGGLVEDTADDTIVEEVTVVDITPAQLAELADTLDAEEAPVTDTPADDRPALTLTVYRVGNLPFPTRKAAEWHVFGYGPQGAEIVEEAHTYHVGDAVTVHAFGQSHRPGTVTKLGRSRVTVDFVRNQSGRRHVAAFGADRVRLA